MTRKDKIELVLFGFVAVATACALVASMGHMLTAFGYANEPVMAWVLAVVTVLMNAVFIVLGSTVRDHKVRLAIIFGMILLFLVEFWGNFAVGGLLAMKAIPPEMSELFFGFSRQTLVWAGAILFAAFLPILNFISVYATSMAGMQLLEKSSQPEQSNYWADMVVQFHEKQQAAQSQTDTDKAS